MNRKNTASVLLSLAMLGGGVATAGAATAAGGNTSAPTIHNWVWRLADGSVWGQCSDGYHPVWNRVGDPAATDYRLTNGQSIDGIDSQHMTWAQIEQARAEGKAWSPITVAFNDLEGRGETSLGNAAAPADGMIYEGDCVTNGYTYPVGEYHGGSDTDPSKFVQLVNLTRHHDAVTHTEPVTEVRHHDAVTHTEPVTEVRHHDAVPAKTHTVIVPGTPAKTHTVTVPGTPAVTAQRPHLVTRYTNPSVLVQVDRYLPKTAAQAAVVAKLDDDNRLAYREDRALWGASNVAFTTVTAADVKARGSVLAAVQARYGQPVLGNVTAAKAGGSYLKAWCLGVGASAGVNAWGPQHNVTQVDADACPAPVAKAYTVQDGTDTVVVKPATPATTRTVVDAPATPDHTVTVVDAPAVPAYDETVTTGQRTVVDHEAYDETVTTGQRTVVDHEAYDETATVGADEVPARESDGWVIASSGGVQS